MDKIDLLISIQPGEPEDIFNYRKVYSKFAFQFFNYKITLNTAIVLGNMAANKLRYNVIYCEKVEKILQLIDEWILNT